MTKLDKTVRRETTIVLDNRVAARAVDQIVVSLYPGGQIGFRSKGCRREVRLPLEAAYALALKAEAEAARRDKMKAKAAKR